MSWWILLLPITALWALSPQPLWEVMVCIALSILLILKTAALRKYVSQTKCPLSAFQVAIWYLGWPGLDADAFFRPCPQIRASTRLEEWIAAIGKTVLGVAVLLGIVPVVAGWNRLAGGWLAMFGLLMLFHFGGFHLLALIWRGQGRSVQPIMHRPLLATSVHDFWSHRWNLAFRDFATQFVMRPVARRWNASLAQWACFVFSGLVHELAISVPARGGYGLPMAYFLLQAIGVSVERSSWGVLCGLRRGVRGWLFALFVIGPASFFLFHPPFITRVILPLVGVPEIFE